MIQFLVRLFAFFGKEFNEIRRQPQLLISILLGPILILLLVGAGYRGERSPLDIGLIVSEALKDDPRIADTLTLIRQNFNVVELEADVNIEQALTLENIDVVQEIPADYAEKLDAGEAVDITFTYDVLDPQLEQYIRYAGFRQVDEANNQILLSGVETAQSDAQSALEDLQLAEEAISALNSATTQQDIDTTIDMLEQAQAAVALLQSTSFVSSEEEKQEAEELLNELSQLEEALQNSNDNVSSGRLEEVATDIDDFSTRLNDLQSRSPSAIVAPFRPAYNNLSGEALSLVTFFAPSVAAFVLQHIGITLGSLSLVRERMRGTREFYIAAPISIMQVLIGKYLAYMLFLSIITVGLVVALVYAIGVPFLGSVWALIGILTLLNMSSVGLGFLISVISRSDIQAVQFAMLALLFAVFFSGFILPIPYYTVPIRYIGYALPITHAIEALQTIMLRGEPASTVTWGVLAGMSALSFIAASLVWHRQN